METNQTERQRWNDERWAELWPRRERMTDVVTSVLLAAVALRPGEHVLDIGSGGGKAALAAAGAVGTEGTVTGADISTPLCRLAERRAAAAAVANVTFHVTDVQVDHLDGGPFDVAMSQFGVMFFDDPRAAFANIRGALRPGGRIGFACWQGVDRNPWFFGSALAGIIPPPAPLPPGKSPTGPFTFADPDRVREILTEAGFVDVSVLPREETIEVPEDSVVDDAQLTLSGVPADLMISARAAVAGYMAQFRQPGGQSRLPLGYQIVTALNPGGAA